MENDVLQTQQFCRDFGNHTTVIKWCHHTAGSQGAHWNVTPVVGQISLGIPAQAIYRSKHRHLSKITTMWRKGRMEFHRRRNFGKPAFKLHSECRRGHVRQQTIESPTSSRRNIDVGSLFMERQSIADIGVRSANA